MTILLPSPNSEVSYPERLFQTSIDGFTLQGAPIPGTLQPGNCLGCRAKRWQLSQRAIGDATVSNEMCETALALATLCRAALAAQIAGSPAGSWRAQLAATVLPEALHQTRFFARAKCSFDGRATRRGFRGYVFKHVFCWTSSRDSRLCQVSCNTPPGDSSSTK